MLSNQIKVNKFACSLLEPFRNQDLEGDKHLFVWIFPFDCFFFVQQFQTRFVVVSGAPSSTTTTATTATTTATANEKKKLIDTDQCWLSSGAASPAAILFRGRFRLFFFVFIYGRHLSRRAGSLVFNIVPSFVFFFFSVFFRVSVFNVTFLGRLSSTFSL